MLQLFCILFLMHFIVKFRPQNTILLLPGGGSIVSHASHESVSYTNCCEPPHPHPPPFPCDPIKERQASETAACLAINTLCGPDSNPASFTTPASQAGERRLMLILSIKHLITLLICSCALAFHPLPTRWPKKLNKRLTEANRALILIWTWSRSMARGSQ